MYFALHNNNIRAVLNRMKVNTVHVWQDSRDEMCKFCGQEAAWFPLNEERANRKGRMQARGRGRHLSKLLNSWRKAQFGLRSSVAMWRVAVEENWAMWSQQRSSPGRMFTDWAAQTIGTRFYKRWSHVATGEIRSSQWMSKITAAHILTRLQRGCNV
jgi:hypothetical protein